MDKPGETITASRRTFLRRSAILAAGAVALPGAGVTSTNQSDTNREIDAGQVQFCGCG